MIKITRADRMLKMSMKVTIDSSEKGPISSSVSDSLWATCFEVGITTRFLLELTDGFTIEKRVLERAAKANPEHVTLREDYTE